MSEVTVVSGAEQKYGAQFNARANAEDMKNQFLTMLVAQMKHQDPMNPVENQEFVAQLAQFSSLEQLITTNESIEYLNKGVDYIATLLTMVYAPPNEGGDSEKSD